VDDDVSLTKSMKPARGLVVGAPHSGSGKTSLTIGLLRAFARRGVNIAPAKIGPDYIDPQFHEVAAGVPSLNLDGWAMRQDVVATLGRTLASQSDFTLVEGVMGLFDGAVKPGVLGHGASADIARFFDLPVVLVVDCSGMGQSVAALVNGFVTFDPSIKIAGVILNKLGSLRHVAMMERALNEIGVSVLGAVPRAQVMALPSRHLGLVQARETLDIEQRIELIADHVEAHVALDEILAVSGGFEPVKAKAVREDECIGIAPLGQHIGVARDDAFAFFYPHVQRAWERSQVQLSFFSPLADEVPDERADAIYLPGGYPELYAGQLADNARFMAGLQSSAKEGKKLYGECGGYMVLGRGLIDKEGRRHKMAGLLDLETSFEKRKLHLGYRHVEQASDGQVFRGLEFHYASILQEEGAPLFQDVEGEGQHGLKAGSVSGSFVHLIDGAGI